MEIEKKNILKISAIIAILISATGLSIQPARASTRLDWDYFLSTDYSHNINPGSYLAAWHFGSGYSCWGYFTIDSGGWGGGTCETPNKAIPDGTDRLRIELDKGYDPSNVGWQAWVYVDGQKVGELAWGWNTIYVGADDDYFTIHISVGQSWPYVASYWGFDYIKWEAWDD